ncbi:MAG: hypothetical protein ACTMIB_09010, partial [Cellulosimicrobium funkei]
MTAATGRAGGAPRGASSARGRRVVGRVDARARLALLARSGWADARLGPTCDVMAPCSTAISVSAT